MLQAAAEAALIASITILSYWRMARLVPDLPDACAVVSILNPRRDPLAGRPCCAEEGGAAMADVPRGYGDLEAEPIFAADDPRVHVVRFWDVEDGDSPDPAFYSEWPPITDEQAEAVARFLWQAQQDPVALPLFVHCAAGISRSAAVAEVAGILAGIPYLALLKAHPYIRPNATVKVRVLRALRREGWL